MRNMDGEYFLRHKEHGEIYRFDDRLASSPKLEKVTRQEAFPKLYAPKGALPRDSKVDISVPEEVANPPPYVAPELAAQLGTTFNPNKVTVAKAPRKVNTTGAGLVPKDT